MFRFLRSVLRPATAAFVVTAVAGRLAEAWRRGSRAAAERRRVEREVLPSLYDLHPRAAIAGRRSLGLRSVPLDRVAGTLRRPSQNTADFLPLPQLRGRNWQARWQRILAANDRLETLPPVELVKVGERYFVEDGHNRVAAARRSGAVEVDAVVTELQVEGEPLEPAPADVRSTLVGARELRDAASGRHSRTAEHRFGGQDRARTELAEDTPDRGEGG